MQPALYMKTKTPVNKWRSSRIQESAQHSGYVLKCVLGSGHYSTCGSCEALPVWLDTWLPCKDIPIYPELHNAVAVEGALGFELDHLTASSLPFSGWIFRWPCFLPSSSFPLGVLGLRLTLDWLCWHLSCKWETSRVSGMGQQSSLSHSLWFRCAIKGTGLHGGAREEECED